jgi:hypothetical protein
VLLILAALAGLPLLFFAVFGIGHGTLMRFGNAFIVLSIAWIALLAFSTVGAIALVFRPEERTRRAYVAVLSGFIVCSLVFVPPVLKQ